jgi:hypothetical protein
MDDLAFGGSDGLVGNYKKIIGEECDQCGSCEESGERKGMSKSAK